jgi:hypothetical protein
MNRDFRFSQFYTMVLLGTFFVLCGCTYTTDLRNFDTSFMPWPVLKEKRVAVIIDSKMIQDDHTTSTDVYSFSFTHVRDGLKTAIERRIGGSAKEVKFVTDEPAPAGYDLYIYPEAKLRSVHDFWTMGCYIELNMRLKDEKGRVLADESGKGKRNFFSASGFNEKCNLAMSEVFNKVSARLLSTPQN